jgi:PhnB protein
MINRTGVRKQAMQIQPYIFFEGRAEEALNFYRTTLGAEVTALMRYKESPDQNMIPPGGGEKIMHGSFSVDGATVMVSDGHVNGAPNFKGFGLSMMPSSIADAEKKFAALSAGGQVQVPLTKTFFSPCFGMVTDRFGVLWLIYVVA